MKFRRQAMLFAAPFLIAIGGGVTMHAPSARAQTIDPYAVPPPPPTGAPDDVQTIEPPARAAPAPPATGYGPRKTGTSKAIVPPHEPSCTGAACDEQPVDAAAPPP